MEEEKIIQLEDFFDFGSKLPVNRIAYTEEDMKYKVKIIEKMQQLGMKVTVDEVGNICGSITVGRNPKKVVAIGSHTDSVYNGGQYDGPVGVVVGLQTVEELIKRGKCNGTIKVAIYACEESSRFGNACIGSKYLNGTITKKDFDTIIDQKAKKEGSHITLAQAVEFARQYLRENTTNVEEVEKIFDEVDYALEAHIEQYDILRKEYKKANKKDIVGIINSIGSAVRIKYEAKGKSDHTGATPMKKRSNACDATAYIGKKVRKLGKIYEKKGLGRASQVEISTPGHNGSFNQIPAYAEGMIDFRLLGENTPNGVLKEFEEIVRNVEHKTNTEIISTVVSRGTPVITSKKLNSKLTEACESQGIIPVEMPSYAGQDTGYVPAKEKTMIFIPSKGGSHNPEESTKRKFITPATKIFTETVQELLMERFKDRQVVNLNNTYVGGNQVQNQQKSKEIENRNK